MDQNDKTEAFLDKYRELEALIRNTFRLKEKEPALPYLTRRAEFQSIQAELDYCREVRNFLSHNPKINNSYLVEPSQALISLLEETIRKIQNPLRARDIAVPREKVLCRTALDRIAPTLEQMYERGFSHVPILKNGAVWGMFSENTLLSCLVTGRGVFDETASFEDIKAFLPLKAHKGESFRFVGERMLATDVADIFENAIAKGDKVGMVFVTRTGGKSEPLEGIITAWDVAGL